MEWEEVRLKDITSKIASGATPKGGKSSYLSKGITLVRSLNIYNFSFKYQDLAYINESQASKLSNVILEENDILLNITGASVGRCTVVPTHLLPARINQHVMIVRSNQSLVDYRYLLYTINSSHYKKQLMLLAETGTTREALTKSDIENFKIKLPPLKTQKKIATILSNYDKLIENNTQRIKLLESMAEEIYKEWFVRLRFPEYEQVEIVDGIPVGWNKEDITVIAHINEKTINLKKAPKYIRYIDIASVQTGFYESPEIINFRDAPSRARRVLRYGDTIFSTVRPNRKTFSLILENDSTLIASTGFAVITPKNLEDFAFIYFSVSQQSFVDSVVAKATGATYPAINQKNFEKLQIIIPSKSILEKFSKQIIPILEMKHLLLEKNKILKETRDLLLPKLINGTLDVSEIA